MAADAAAAGERGAQFVDRATTALQHEVGDIDLAVDCQHQVLVAERVAPGGPLQELAEIDTALLVDDLPPAAYSDPGFVQFLRQSAAETDTPSAN